VAVAVNKLFGTSATFAFLDCHCHFVLLLKKTATATVTVTQKNIADMLSYLPNWQDTCFAVIDH
jgi:hypothetical protein